MRKVVWPGPAKYTGNTTVQGLGILEWLRIQIVFENSEANLGCFKYASLKKIEGNIRNECPIWLGTKTSAVPRIHDPPTSTDRNEVTVVVLVGSEGDPGDGIYSGCGHVWRVAYVQGDCRTSNKY